MILWLNLMLSLLEAAFQPPAALHLLAAFLDE